MKWVLNYTSKNKNLLMACGIVICGTLGFVFLTGFGDYIFGNITQNLIVFAKTIRGACFGGLGEIKPPENLAAEY